MPRNVSSGPGSSSTRIDSPISFNGAPGTWNGPKTVGSVVPSAACWLIISTNIDSPSVSDSRMNSWRWSSHLWPTAVRKSIPANHSSRVSPTSSANANKCLIAARVISPVRSSAGWLYASSTSAR